MASLMNTDPDNCQPTLVSTYNTPCFHLTDNLYRFVHAGSEGCWNPELWMQEHFALSVTSYVAGWYTHTAAPVDHGVHAALPHSVEIASTHRKMSLIPNNKARWLGFTAICRWIMFTARNVYYVASGYYTILHGEKWNQNFDYGQTCKLNHDHSKKIVDIINALILL